MKNKIAIVSPGLIGGSIIKKLSTISNATKYELFIVSSSVEAKKHLFLKYTQNISSDLSSLKNCDLIFVTTPISKTIEVLNKLNDILSPHTVVTDVCSTKTFLANKSFNYQFIGSHPMAGTEKQGFENSFESMFENATWAIVNYNNKKIQKNSLLLLEKIIKDLGAKPLYTNCYEHDKAVALISHSLIFISQAIYKNVEHDDLALKLASTGFSSMVRLLNSNTQMANDMLTFNKENILHAIETLKLNIDKLFSDKHYIQTSENLKKSYKQKFQHKVSH